MSGALYVATFATALGCGLVAGAFFAFSSFVMAALGRLPAVGGIAAMQSINVVVINPVFMIALFGTGVACLGLIVWAVISAGGATATLVVAGCLLYLFGTVGVTAVCNVPLNNRLAGLRPGDPGAATFWNEYLRRWTAWNHVRTVAALLALAVLMVAL
jgi:uncharacterized membrane protein